MESAAREFLFRLLKTPSPSGYEQPIQHLVREYLAGCADTVTTDSHGNVIGAKNAAAATRMLLAGHCDQIGLIIQYIDADGFISVQPIGGWDPIQLVGSRVAIWTASGPVTGVMSRKPIHLLTEEERKRLLAWPDATVLYGAHEYTAANARFTLSVDDRPEVAAHAASIFAARERGEPTVPFSLAMEAATNPFVRAGSVAELARRRSAKDNFRG